MRIAVRPSGRWANRVRVRQRSPSTSPGTASTVDRESRPASRRSCSATTSALSAAAGRGRRAGSRSRRRARARRRGTAPRPGRARRSSTATASARQNRSPSVPSVTSTSTRSPGIACRTKTTRPSSSRATQCPPWATGPTSTVMPLPHPSDAAAGDGSAVAGHDRPSCQCAGGGQRQRRVAPPGRPSAVGPAVEGSRPARRRARASTRSRRRRRPGARRDAPSSVTSMPQAGRLDAQRHGRPSCADECRATLVRASSTMRYAATSTAAGSAGSSSGTTSVDAERRAVARRAARPPAGAAPAPGPARRGRVAAWRRPAGGCPRSRSSCRRAAARAGRRPPSGSVRTRLRAASEVNAMPDSRGPSPSWRSRRSRRRSSSIAVMAVSRDSWRSAASARARRVWASSGATRRSTCSSPADRRQVARPQPDHQLGAGVAAEAGRRGCACQPCPRRPAPHRRRAGRRTAAPAPRGSPAAPAPGRRRCGRRPGVAASSGSGRPPNSSSSTTPRSSDLQRVEADGGEPADHGQRARPAASRRRPCRAATPPREHRDVGDHGDARDTTASVTTPRTSTMLGQRHADVQAGPTRPHDAGRRTARVARLGGEARRRRPRRPVTRRPSGTSRRGHAARAPRRVSIRHQVCAKSRQPPMIPSGRPRPRFAATASVPSAQPQHARRRRQSTRRGPPAQGIG